MNDRLAPEAAVKITATTVIPTLAVLLTWC